MRVPLARCVPWLAAVGAAAAIVVATGGHGPGISLDSVVYARAAESVVERGALEVPLTRWDSDAAYVPLSHFPPLLPLVLTGVSHVLDIDAYTAGRWLNVVCIAASVLVATLPVAKSPSAVLVVVAFFMGPSFLTMHTWLWSEPLYLLLVVTSVRLATPVLARESSPRLASLLGVCCGLATLTRYAGVSLVAAFAILIAASGASLGTKVERTAWLGGGFLVTVLPWGWFLSTVAGPPRELGFYMEGMWSGILVPMARTMTSWFVPASLPMVPAVLIVATLLVAIAIRARAKIRAGEGVRLGAAAWMSAVVLVVYVLCLVAARVTVDPAMPLDERLLSPVLVLVALGLAEVAKALDSGRVELMPTALVAWLGLVNAAASAPHLLYSARSGLGYANEQWDRSETIARLRSVSADVTIFSNAPDILVARLPVAAKYTPAEYEGARLAELSDRIEHSAPSLVVLFDDPHAGWLVPRDRLLAALASLDRETLADAIVLSRGPTGIAR